MPLMYAWMVISCWSVKRMETCTLSTSHKKGSSLPGYVCLRVRSELDLLLFCCACCFCFCFYLYVHFINLGFGRFWCKKYPVRSRKRTTISSQRRANRLQVMFPENICLLEQIEMLSFFFFSEKKILNVYFLKHCHLYRNVPCVPHG